MRIVVCVRQGLDGEIGPFDACAYEEALKIPDAEVILLSMGPANVKGFLENLTRLGASGGVLLCDPAFAGADTLATAYALGKAIERIEPDFIFCGRQTMIGDTAQVPPMLAEGLGLGMIANVMEIREILPGKICCITRDGAEVSKSGKVLLTVERINNLRLPRLRSKIREVAVWGGTDIGAEPEKCGLAGSPTRVVKTFENQSGKRKCTFISRDQLDEAVKTGLEKSKTPMVSEECGNMEGLLAVGEAPIAYAKKLSRKYTVIPLTEPETVAQEVQSRQPNAVLWGSDAKSKEAAARVAAKLQLGLCADCTQLEQENGELMMYRPALSGRVYAKIRSLRKPAMATVRTEDSGQSSVVVGLGFGVRNDLERAKAFAKEMGASVAASRKLVDNDYMPYESQVGLTGKTVSPAVYIAVGISGAVHHIAGMERAGTVIAINPDKDAPIFEYADFGIVDHF